MSKLKTYCFKWSGPVSSKQLKTGGFQCLAVHMLLRQDLAFIPEVAPEILPYQYGSVIKAYIQPKKRSFQRTIKTVPVVCGLASKEIYNGIAGGSLLQTFS